MRRTPVRTREHPTPKPDDLTITMVTMSRWRVADSRIDGGAGISLLGFVDLQNGHYEVTRFDTPAHLSAYDDLAPALEEFLAGPGGREYLHPDRVPELLSAGAYSRVA
jgi:hypothetical protein